MTVNEARMQWWTRRKRFVVGYVASGNLLYGGSWSKTRARHNDAIFPLTRKQAEVKLAEMASPGAVIFELRPMNVNR